MKLLFVLIFVSLYSVANGFQCPGDGLFSNPENTHSFYQCAHGIHYLMQCPAGLVWNQQIQVCDWNTHKPTINCDYGNQNNCRATAEWSTQGTPIVGTDRQFGSDAFHLGSPFGLFVDRERNNVYIADTENHRVQKFNLKAIGGAGTTVAGGNGRGSGSNQLNMPWAVYVDKNENVYVADTDNSRVQMWAKGATSGVIVAGGNGKGKGLNQIGAC
ncbi:unnamed protein product [Rotaria sp. Silwood2]|nr:unnamed protein product [Rotaria sp. Silwood2]CAF3014342.1 unnamed protein product [Rotaria sp. Silwood2]CAF4271880.1 unnamed protein product [Rotaria sp. Silwood2]